MAYSLAAVHMDFFLNPLIVPFAAVLLVLVGLAVVETALFLAVGAGMTHALNLLDFDSFADSALLNWFFVRGVPFMLVLVAAMLGFGAGGLLVQSIAVGVMGAALPLLVAVPLALVAGVFTIRLMTSMFKRTQLVSTKAVSRATFIGRVATVTSNRASHHAPGEAVLRDEHGAPHYVMLRPADPTELLFEGDQAELTAALDDGFFDARRHRPHF